MQGNAVTAAAVGKQSVEEHTPQLYLALALLCKGSALVTVKNTEVNNGLESRTHAGVLRVLTEAS